MIKHICKVCNQTFRSYLKDSKYCSRKCMGDDRKGKQSKKYAKVKLKCLFCNQTFLVSPYRKSMAKYCSKSCNRKDKTGIDNPLWKEKKRCQDCNKELSVHGKQKELALRCRNCYNVKRVNNNQSKEYKLRRLNKYRIWRKYIFERDDYTCVLCNKRGCYLEAHHIQKISSIINTDLNLIFDKKNGVTLCKKCHQSYVNRHEEEYVDYCNLIVLDREILNNNSVNHILQL